MDKVLVIDMQNAYSAGNPWECTGFSDAEDNIVRLLNSVDKANVYVTKFLAPKNPTGTWVDYNKCNAEVNEDDYLNELTDKIKENMGEARVFSKSTYSSFYNINREDRLVLCGVVSECCVLATLLDAIGKCREIIYLKDCVAGQIDDRYLMYVIEELKARSVKVMTLDEYLEMVSESMENDDKPFNDSILNGVNSVTVNNVVDYRHDLSMVFKAIDKGLRVVMRIDSRTDVALVAILKGLEYAQIDFKFDTDSLRTLFPSSVTRNMSDEEVASLYLSSI